MKKYYFFWAIISFLLTADVFGQKNTKKTETTTSPFKKGTVSFANRPNLTYTNFSSLVNGDPKSFDMRVDPSYFVIDGLAIGLDARAGSNSSKNTKASYSFWQTDLTVTYGRNIKNNLNAYIKLFAGPGGSQSSFDISSAGTIPQKLKATYFDIKGLIGVPIALHGSGPAYFTPYVSYDYYKTKTTSNDFTDKTIAFGFKFESYINGANGNDKDREEFSNSAYQKGSHFLDFNTNGGISSDTRQQTQRGSTTQIGQQKIRIINFGAGYQYFIIDNVAVGLNISINSNKTGYRGTTPSTTSTFLAGPVVTVHAPAKNALKNLFLQAAYSVGSYREPKKKLSDLSVKTGYNIFLAKYLTLTPKIGYERISGNIPKGVSGIAYVNSGIAAEIGVRTWLNFWKWK